MALYYETTKTTDPGPFVSIVRAARPALKIALEPNGDVTVTFTDTLQSASEPGGIFSDLPSNPHGTYTIPKASLLARQYFRARN